VKFDQELQKIGLNTPVENVYDPLPISEHQDGIIFYLPLGKLVHHSFLRNSVFIYSGGKSKLADTFLNLLYFGMVVEKNLVAYFEDQFVDMICEEVDDF
jgi:hypothetical protein